MSDKTRPPGGVVGEPVPVTLLLGRSAQALVRLQHFTAYPTGFEFQVVAHYTSDEPIYDPLCGLAGKRSRPAESGRLSDEHLRLQLLMPSGARLDNFGPPLDAASLQSDYTTRLQAFDARADVGASVSASYWVQPLPNAGLLQFTCEWPRFGIPPRSETLDADLILEAARRCTAL